MRNLEIKFMYSSDEDDFISLFYNPCLRISDTYHRAVGFFNSSIFKDIHEGLQEFIYNGGKIKLICSPNLSEEDIRKIEKGYSKREVVQDHLINLIKESNSSEFIDVAWLIEHQILDVKIVVGLWDKDMLYHEKYGLFFNDEDYVAFWGSSNESHNAVRRNYESFTTMKSWERQEECLRFKEKFVNIWEGKNSLLETYDFPEAAKKQLLRKYNPKSFEPEKYNIWEFQDDAVDMFVSNESKLIYEMATGTGKTRTALKTIKEVFKENQNVVPIVLVNKVDLMYQWGDNIKDFLGVDPIFVGDGHDYQSELENYIYSRHFGTNELSIIVAIDKSFRTHFLKYLSSLNSSDIFIIYDEAHNITSNILHDLPESKYRLGLTATLERKNQAEVEKIRDYFGKKSFIFGIDKAIKLGVLTQYDYNIIPVEMTEIEYTRYSKLTLLMVSVMNDKEISLPEKDRKISEIAQNRALIIKKMENKTDCLINVLKKKDIIDKTVIYCGSGKNVDGDRIIEHLTKEISTKVSNSLKMNHYTYHEANQRPLILNYFKEGFYDILLAIKCLDEGVDIPMLQHLYILASDKSTKQTIQRRGRVMRSFDNKHKCYITDFVAIPPNNINNGFSNSLLSNEILRVEEYNSISLNRESNKKQIKDLRDKYMKEVHYE